MSLVRSWYMGCSIAVFTKFCASPSIRKKGCDLIAYSVDHDNALIKYYESAPLYASAI